MFYDENFLEMFNPKMFLDIIKVCVSHVLFPYCSRSLILIVSSRNIEKAGDSQKRYGL